MNLGLEKSWLSSMQDFVVEILQKEQPPIKYLNVLMNRCPKYSRLSSMQDFVVDILQQEQPPIKSLEHATIGQTYFQMCTRLLEFAPNVSYSLERNK